MLTNDLALHYDEKFALNDNKLLGEAQVAVGNVFDSTAPTKRVTVPFPLRISEIMGPYTERDRKLYVFLLHAAHTNLEKKTTHSISISEAEGLFEHLGRGKDRGWLWQSAKNLASTTIQWITRDEQGRLVTHMTPLLSYASKKQGTDTLEYEFPDKLIPVLIAPYRFSRVRTHFLLGLAGKYSVTLYEILEAFTRDGVLEASIQDIREWLGIKEGSLKEFKALRRRAIEPAVQQINENAHHAGFTVQFVPIKKGRSVIALKFLLTKTPERLRDEKSASKRKRNGEKTGVTLHFRGETYEKARQVAPRLDIYDLEQQFHEWVNQKEEKPLNREAAFIAFCRKKGKLS